MRKTVIQLLAAVVLGNTALLGFFTGCSKAPEAPPKEVTIQADDKMRYDVTAFDASPGQKVSVTPLASWWITHASDWFGFIAAFWSAALIAAASFRLNRLEE